MAFLSWLMSQGHSLNDIAQAMVQLGDSGTLAQVYANLTSDSAANAWPNFQAAVNALPSITTDDPFGAVGQPAQLAHLPPWTVEVAGKVFASILADVIAGREPHQIVAGVRAAMVMAPKRGGRRSGRSRLLDPLPEAEAAGRSRSSGVKQCVSLGPATGPATPLTPPSPTNRKRRSGRSSPSRCRRRAKAGGLRCGRRRRFAGRRPCCGLSPGARRPRRR